MPRRAAACLGEQTRRLGDQMVDAESTPRTIDVVKLRGSRNLLVLRELYWLINEKQKTWFVVGWAACPISVESHLTREDDIWHGWVEAIPPFQCNEHTVAIRISGENMDGDFTHEFLWYSLIGDEIAA
ncbi:hypothetical protein DPMN_146110 [Dreissena polymorpha]|uniref:Uncharacterized protein n=1 Tax=Dreissena polymorpha TaxID=45954 RepID=A0A9D4F806_DREPO|nr:hypothetical protein DPMN_146110 [Dreissena polymorpha]